MTLPSDENGDPLCRNFGLESDMLDHSPRLWLFFRTETSLWFRPTARRRSISRLRTIEAIEARCLLSASGLIADFVANHTGSESKPLQAQQNLPSVENGANSSAVAASIQKQLTETKKELRQDLNSVNVSDAVEPRKTTGVASAPVVTVSGSTSSVSSKTYVGDRGWKISFYFRPNPDSSLGSSLSSSTSTSDRGQSSLRPNLAESLFSSAIRELSDQRSNNDSGQTLLLDWSSMSADPVIAGGATASALQKSAAMMASDSSSTDIQAMESPSAVALAIATTAESTEDFVAAGRSTTERFQQLNTDSLSGGVTNSSGTSGTSAWFQNSLTALFTNEQIASRYDAAAARPVTTPQTARPESDLILTGKQGRKLVSKSDENPDTFFLRNSFKFLLIPESEAEQLKLDKKNKPNVPGNEGNVDPGHAPQNNGKDAPAPSRDATSDDMKEGSMTWAGLLLVAASGFRSLRNRRKRQRNAA